MLASVAIDVAHAAVLYALAPGFTAARSLGRERRIAQEGRLAPTHGAARTPLSEMMNRERTPKKPTARVDTEAREALLRDLPGLIGTQWADAVCTEALQSRGSVEGGWPCTLPEARSRVAQVLGGRLTVLRWAPLTPHELAEAAATAYDGARRAWQHAAKQLGRNALARARAPKPVG